MSMRHFNIAVDSRGIENQSAMMVGCEVALVRGSAKEKVSYIHTLDSSGCWKEARCMVIRSYLSEIEECRGTCGSLVI